MAREPEQELDTDQLLEQGDALLRSSRRLLDDLDDVIDLRDDEAAPAAGQIDAGVRQTGSSSDSR